jgi:hypothetical protein
MKRLACTLLAIVLGSVLPALAESPQEPTDADFDWVWRFQKQALDGLMPLELKPGQVIAYRSDHDLQRIGDIERRRPGWPVDSTPTARFAQGRSGGAIHRDTCQDRRSPVCG